MTHAEAVTALLRRCKVAFSHIEEQSDGRVLVHVPAQKNDPLTTIRKLYAGMEAGAEFSILYGKNVREDAETFWFAPRKA